jgi:ketosteroid isomerase-like protein
MKKSCMKSQPCYLDYERTLAFLQSIPVLVLGLLATGCACCHTTDRSAGHPEAQAQIEQRLQEVLVAAENKDFDRLDACHLYGPKFTKFSGSSPERLDAVAARSREHAGLGSLTGLKMRADALKVDVFGDVGIATFILDYSFQSGTEVIHRSEHTTLVFVKDRGAWKITHEHLSPVKP